MSAIVVSPDGDDASPGTAARPVRSLARAQTLARQQIAGDRQGELRVCLRGGVYRLGNSLVFTAEDGGRDNLRVTWAAWPGEHAVISGGELLSKWHPGSDGSWRAALPPGMPSPEQLAVADSWADWASFPDGDGQAGWYRVAAVERDPAAPQDRGWRVTLADGPALPATSDGPLYLAIAKSWSSFLAPVASCDPASRVLTLSPETRLKPVESTQRWHPNLMPNPKNWPHFRAWLWGNPSFVNRPGEWAVDSTRREVVYRPRAGQDIAGAPGTASCREQLVVIAGTAERPVRNLHFEDIELAYAAYRLPLPGTDDRQAAWPTLDADGRAPLDLEPSAFTAQHWQDGSFLGGALRLCGGHGMRLGAGCRGLRIAGTRFEDIGANGIAVGTPQDPGPESPELIRSIAISDCRVLRAGRLRWGAVGIWVGFAQAVSIVHNEVAELPYTGISVGWLWDPSATSAGGHDVSQNHVHDVMRLLCDGAGIYALGRQTGSRMADNRIHAIVRDPDAHAAPLAGLYFDQGSQGWRIKNNVVYDVVDRAVNMHKAGLFPDDRPTDTPDALLFSGNVFVAATDGAAAQRQPFTGKGPKLYRAAVDNTDALVKWEENRILSPVAWESASGAVLEKRASGPRESWRALAPSTAPGATPALPVQWRASEFSFTAAADYPDVFAPDGARLEAVFTGPGQETFTIPGFWDGGRAWIVRFAPTTPGVWNYVTRFSHADDTGLHERRGTFEVAPAAGDNPLYRHGGILRVAPTRRYLTYADGTPFFWLGDTWWFCPSELMPIDHSNRPGIDSMFKYLVDIRAAQGYSVIHLAFLGASGVKGSYSDLFEGRWNADYWRQVDRYLQYAAEKGLLPVIGLGFHRGLEQPSLDQLQRLWQYFLARYSAFPVTFLICGEYNLANGKTAAEIEADKNRAAKLLALGDFIGGKDPYRRAMTVHPWWYGGDRRQAWDKPWLDFILIQGGHSKEGPPPAFYREVYARGAPKPFIESECTYEGIHGFDAQTVRHNAYKAIQCGSFGFTYGAHGLWYPTQDENDSKFKEWGTPIPWWTAAELEGGKQMRHLRTCYESVDWWTLEPRANAVPANPKLLVKACADRTFLIWHPAGADTQANTFLKGTRVGGHYSAEWFDPRSGRRQPIGALAAAVDGLALPAPPNQDDWMLILRGADF